MLSFFFRVGILSLSESIELQIRMLMFFVVGKIKPNSECLDNFPLIASSGIIAFFCRCYFRKKRARRHMNSHVQFPRCERTRIHQKKSSSLWQRGHKTTKNSSKSRLTPRPLGALAFVIIVLRFVGICSSADTLFLVGLA